MYRVIDIETDGLFLAVHRGFLTVSAGGVTENPTTCAELQDKSEISEAVTGFRGQGQWSRQWRYLTLSQARRIGWLNCASLPFCV